MTPQGWSNFDGVRKIWADDILSITTHTGKNIKCTSDHLLYTKLGFMPVATLQLDYEIYTTEGFERVLSINTVSPEHVYDLINVKDSPQYFTNSILSHNCEFHGSSGTLIAGWKLKELVAAIPIREKDGLKQFEQPQKGHNYSCVVDVSRGRGFDYSAFHIVDVTKMPYKQVCTFRNNLITPLDYADVIFQTCKNYNNCAVLIETNDIGEQVARDIMYEFEYENILSTTNAGRAGKKISSGFSPNTDYGVKTTKTVKSVGCSILKLLIEQNQLLINDFETIHELSVFSRKGTSFEAEEGNHDDLVMGLVLFAWLSDQQYFKELTDINTLMKLREKTDEEIMADLLPFGFIDDGMSEFDDAETMAANWAFSSR